MNNDFFSDFLGGFNKEPNEDLTPEQKLGQALLKLHAQIKTNNPK